LLLDVHFKKFNFVHPVNNYRMFILKILFLNP
jgi:hypothetical protein